MIPQMYFCVMQDHPFVKKTEQEYEKEVNFGEWVCQLMNIEQSS